MRTRTDRIANALAWGFIVLTGGAAFGFTAVGVLYLWPGFDLLHMHLAGYWERMLLAIGFLVAGMPFAGWAALVWRELRRRLQT
jgi:hypothetical protein